MPRAKLTKYEKDERFLERYGWKFINGHGWLHQSFSHTEAGCRKLFTTERALELQNGPPKKIGKA